MWLAVCIAMGCRSGTTAQGPERVVDEEEGRFPHARHAALACTDCHNLDAVLSGEAARPGIDDHAPCDRGACHEDAFLAEPGPICAICHDRVVPGSAGETGLAPYPPERGSRALAAEMSHRQHLDFARMERRVGFHITCVDCHTTDESGTPAMPGHAVCGRCHAPEAATPKIPAMHRCALCHRPRPRQPYRERRLITGDLRFRHSDHQVDRRGTQIRCAECHERSPETTTVGEHPTPRTAACVTCHDDSERTPTSKRMRVCRTCHSVRGLALGILAPRSHLPERERPEDHTLAFRRDHAEEARVDSARCARCHTFMSGSARQVCDECHQVMRPLDHVVTWREYDHGPAASAEADRCATCHTAPFCTTCHSRPPRSHFPASTFAIGGHASLARINLRSCLTCHDPESGCTGSGCHILSPLVPSRGR